MDSARKPHVVCIPAPSQGHIKAMLDLAKILYHRGFHVTFANTELNHRRLLESSCPHLLGKVSGFRFEALGDRATLGSGFNTEAYRENLLASLRGLLSDLNDTAASNAPPVSCIVSDCFVLDIDVVAQELGVPLALYFTMSGSCLMAMKHFAALVDKGLTPLKDESYLTNGYLDQIVDFIPAMKHIRLRDFPSFVRTTDPNDFMFALCRAAAEKAFKSSAAIVVHSFDALELEVLDALSSIFPRVYSIGPLPILLKELPQDCPVKSLGHSLWKEDVECLQWLNSWQPESVIYVNFGSVAVLTPQQVIEFGYGLANSKIPFLWIIRPDLVIGDGAILPPEFMENIKGRGMVTSWCPQEQVLEHPSVGGFLTHCGWNSAIESIAAGMPMLCWPFFGDQQTNCRYACREWEIGLEIKNEVKREEVEKLVRELMEGEVGKEIRSKAMEWKRKAEEATGIHGSSSIALDRLIHQLLLPKGQSIIN